ncbi:helix-turn-helix domain-containing protein [Micromonospora ureilytica]|uniref:helix-turn-helix domain-containing protein n=1 Tax=Micromonospora ureilytica TaxID=709868 RepID=UPI004039B7D2
MAWSTRELAEHAGTTVNTVRYYHRIGLLDEPQRRHNGYKQYGVADLARLRCIRRLVELHVPLSKIDATGSRVLVPADVLREVDASLAAELERLSRARRDIAVILRDHTAAELRPDVEASNDPASADHVTPSVTTLTTGSEEISDLFGAAGARQVIDADGGYRTAASACAGGQLAAGRPGAASETGCRSKSSADSAGSTSTKFPGPVSERCRPARRRPRRTG